MKKLISVVLTVVMLFALAAPAFTASAAENYVTVYVEGYGGSLVDANGEYIWDGGPKESMMTGLKEVFNDILKDLAKGIITGNYDQYCDRLYNAMAPAFADLILDKNGEASNGSGLGYDMLKKGYSVSKNMFSTGSITFKYDWRLSVETNAAILEQFIDRVCREKGYSKVNLVGRCLGGNIVQAYLQNAENLDKINDVVLYIPSTEGVDFISALFSGKVVIDPDAVENFITYSLPYNDTIGGSIDPETYEMLLTVVEFVNEANLLGVGTGAVENILEAVKDNVLARIVRDTYGGFVGYWNMVAPEDVEDAIAFVYNTPELQQEYAGMIEKIRSFHQNVQLNEKETLAELHNGGMEIMIISKYNFPNFPLSENGLAQTDGTALTSATSLGATAANFGTVLDESYIDSLEDSKYLSKDTMIDASTCLLPETTWFIKNLIHSDFPQCVNKLIEKFLTAENFTVFSDEAYPQYLKYDSETNTLSEVIGLDEGDLTGQGTAGKKVNAFLKFFILIAEFFNKIFEKLNLGKLFEGALQA